MTTLRTVSPRSRWCRLPGLVLLVAPVVWMAAPGCEADSDTAEAMFCTDLATQECDALALACSRERADCVTIRAAACEVRATASRTAGRSFKRDNARPCLEQTKITYAKPLIQAADFRALEDKCGRVYEGSASNNDVCMVDADCRGPLVCDKRRCGEARTVAAGANCGNPGERCPTEQYCRKGDEFMVCTARNGAGTPCSTSIECGEAFRCRGAVCIAKLELDAQCDSHDDCLSSYCDPHPPAGLTSTCARGLNFARFSPSCEAYFGGAVPGSMVPVTPRADAGPDSSADAVDAL